MNLPAQHPDRLPQKEFAALLGCSEAMVTKHKQAGRLVMEGKLVCVAESVARIEAWKDPARGGDRTGKPDSPLAGAISGMLASQGASASAAGGGDTDRLNYNVQAAREKLASAQLRELELAREAGSLVVKADRDAAEFGRARAGREAMLSIPDRLAVVLASKSDPAEVHALLLAECRRVCNLLAAMPDAGAGAVPTVDEAEGASP